MTPAPRGPARPPSGPPPGSRRAEPEPQAPAAPVPVAEPPAPGSTPAAGPTTAHPSQLRGPGPRAAVAPPSAPARSRSPPGRSSGAVLVGQSTALPKMARRAGSKVKVAMSMRTIPIAEWGSRALVEAELGLWLRRATMPARAEKVIDHGRPIELVADTAHRVSLHKVQGSVKLCPWRPPNSGGVTARS